MSPKNARTDVQGALIVCRCEGVSLQKIQSCIHHHGACTVDQVKKLTRAGMGPCQGRTCGRIVQTVIASETAAPCPVEPLQARQPVRGVCLTAMAAGAGDFRHPEGPVSVIMLNASETKPN